MHHLNFLSSKGRRSSPRLPHRTNRSSTPPMCSVNHWQGECIVDPMLGLKGLRIRKNIEYDICICMCLCRKRQLKPCHSSWHFYRRPSGRAKQPLGSVTKGGFHGCARRADEGDGGESTPKGINQKSKHTASEPETQRLPQAGHTSALCQELRGHEFEIALNAIQISHILSGTTLTATGGFIIPYEILR